MISVPASTISPLVATLTSLPEECLVGVSGGVDSVALLRALVAAGKRPIVLHFNHGWRGEESEQDAEFVRSLAREMKLKLITAKARFSLKKTEETARAARWKFFARAVARCGCRTLILAHHADDQVETFLLQLFRGGGSGLRGMRSESKRDALVVVRPWLGVWRREIIDYARKNRLRWREDASNGDDRFRRNWIRLRLIPMLQKKLLPGTPQLLWRAAEILGAESEWMESLVAPLASGETLLVRTLRSLPLAQVRRVIRSWLAQRGMEEIGFEEVEAVRRLLTQVTPARINLPRGRYVRRRNGQLFVE